MLAGLSVSTASGRVEQFGFRFSCGAFREDEIFDSASSVPSRYMIEIGRRILSASPGSDSLVIGNPLLPLSPAQLMEWVGGRARQPLILTDRSGFPVVYVLPRHLFCEEGRLLLPLSGVDSTLDARLLGFLTDGVVDQKTLDLDNLDAFQGISANGWLNPDNRLRSLAFQARLAVELMERRSDWRRLPFALFHPYHAGDVLFVAMGSKQATPLLYDKQLVCSSFLDVAKGCSPAASPVELPQAPMARDGSISKYRYFVNAMNRLGSGFTGENFVIFGRLLRMHHYTPFHLLDHAKFTLGDPMDSVSRTIYRQPVAPASLSGLPARPLKLLFHLNGGWALKTYPLDRTKVLFEVLRKLGCEITVLDRPDLEGDGIRSVAGGTTAILKELLDAHHLFVGVDSYPLHYANLVVRRPTIALFGSTKACNHDGPRSPSYRPLAEYLPCDTCLSKSGCPMFGGDMCRNYAEPQAIISAVLEMGLAYYHYLPI